MPQSQEELREEFYKAFPQNQVERTGRLELREQMGAYWLAKLDSAYQKGRGEVLAEIEELTYYRNDEGVTELENNTPYIKVADLQALSNK